MSKNLKVLRKMNNDELKVLIQILLDKGRVTEDLSSSELFRTCHESGNYAPCIDLVDEEIRRFGGNTIVNLFRGGGPEYKEIACDVCEKLDVEVNQSKRMREIDTALLKKVLTKMWEEMEDKDRRELLDSLNIKITTDSNFKAEGLAALLTAFRAGGFASYQLTMIVVNAVAKMILGRGLALATNATINKVLGIATGPIGIALTTMWVVADITGPAYRVTIPVVIYLAAMRQAYRNAPAVS